MQTALGIMTALLGVVIVVSPWAAGPAAGGPLTIVVEVLGTAVALLGLALSHHVFPRR